MYHLKGDTTASHLQQLGELFQTLIIELEPTYAAHETYQLLVRVFREHFQLIETAAPLEAAPPPPDTALRPDRVPSSAPSTVRPDSVPLPDDLERFPF